MFSAEAEEVGKIVKYAEREEKENTHMYAALDEQTPEHTYKITLVRREVGFPQLIFTVILLLLLPGSDERSFVITGRHDCDPHSRAEEVRHQHEKHH